MPEDFGNLFRNFNDLVKLSKEENFRKFLVDSRVRSLMANQEFKKSVQEKNIFKLMTHSEFTELLKDPEVRSLLEGMHKNFDHPS